MPPTNKWKERVLTLLEEHELDHFVTSEVEMPTSTAVQGALTNNQAKAKIIIFYSVKDSILIVPIPLKTPKECFDTLVNLYEKKVPSQKRTLKTKLKYLKMEKGESIFEFFTKISKIRDQLQVVGMKIDDDDLIQVVFDGLPSSWETFLSCINAREH